MNASLHLNQIEDLDAALNLSCVVFKPSKKEIIKYHDKDDWLNKLNNGGLLITMWDEKKIAGFSICYPKEGHFHIWNVGVLNKYRKLGIWKRMYEEIEKFAKNNKYCQLTLNTYKAKFPNMYNFVLNKGFTEYKTEGEKSFFTKKLSNKIQVETED